MGETDLNENVGVHVTTPNPVARSSSVARARLAWGTTHPVLVPTTPVQQPVVRSLEDVRREVRVLRRSPLQRATKRAVDVAGSLVGLILLAPIFLVIAAAVWLSSRGPAFFVQDRCGLGGRTFRFYKFRTMVDGADRLRAGLEHLNEMSGPVFKLRRDPRITRLGSFLRKSSLDELPQLWNVLKGDMSLVGPRPPIPDEVQRYTAHQAQRLAVIPGITGLWQVSGRSEIPDFDRWVALDLEYARRWSLWLDVTLLARTVGVVLRARGAR